MRHLLTCLLTIALCLRFMIPAGFMPVAAANPDSGLFAVVICTGSGPVTQLLDEEGKPLPDLPEQGDYGACAYGAAVTAPVPTLTSYVPSAPLFREAELVQGTHAAPWRVSRHELPEPARGPPLHIS